MIKGKYPVNKWPKDEETRLTDFYLALFREISRKVLYMGRQNTDRDEGD